MMALTSFSGVPCPSDGRRPARLRTLVMAIIPVIRLMSALADVPLVVVRLVALVGLLQVLQPVGLVLVRPLVRALLVKVLVTVDRRWWRGDNGPVLTRGGQTRRGKTRDLMPGRKRRGNVARVRRRCR
jgi:hypothetical protein